MYKGAFTERVSFSVYFARNGITKLFVSHTHFLACGNPLRLKQIAIEIESTFIIIYHGIV